MVKPRPKKKLLTRRVFNENPPTLKLVVDQKIERERESGGSRGVTRDIGLTLVPLLPLLIRRES